MTGRKTCCTLIDAGTRTFAVEAGGSQKALERSQKNLSDKLAAKGLKLPTPNSSAH